MINLHQRGAYYTFTIEIIDCKRYYYVKDHPSTSSGQVLGNIRQTVDENGNIISAQDYAPYGEIIRSYNNADANDKYKFTEKERDKETNLDYFGARYYDAGIGRWLAVDPLASKYPSLSPYVYVHGDPLLFYDPNGKEDNVIVFNQQGQMTGYIEDQNGWNTLTGIVRNESGETTQNFVFGPIQEQKKFLMDNVALIDNGVAADLYINLDFEKKIDNYINPVVDVVEMIAAAGNSSFLGIPELLGTVATASHPGNIMDFYTSQLGYENYAFYLDNNVAYNKMDAGNLLWGAAMHDLGFSLGSTKFAAEANAFLNGNRQNGKEGLNWDGDDQADQRAIGAGWNGREIR